MKPFFGMLFWITICIVVYFCSGCKTEGLHESTGSRGRISTDSGIDSEVYSPSDTSYRKIDSESKLDTVYSKDVFVQQDTQQFNQVDSQIDTFSKTQDVSPELKLLSIGSICNSPNQCSSGNCVDGVCCSVPKCIDTCVPSSTSTCPTYSGWTCSPYGTCRAF